MSEIAPTEFLRPDATKVEDKLISHIRDYWSIKGYVDAHSREVTSRDYIDFVIRNARIYSESPKPSELLCALVYAGATQTEALNFLEKYNQEIRELLDYDNSSIL